MSKSSKDKTADRDGTGKATPVPVGWGSAIVDAEREIQRMERRIAGLRASIRVFRAKLESREPFPGAA
jgi:hypothetical protein